MASMVIFVAAVAAGVVLGVFVVVAVGLVTTAVWAGLGCWLRRRALLFAAALTILHALTYALLKARLLVVMRLLGGMRLLRVVWVRALRLVRLVLVLVLDLDLNLNTLVLTLERVGVDVVLAFVIDRTCPEVIRLVECQMSSMIDGKRLVTL
jgi:hypothetical protein